VRSIPSQQVPLEAASLTTLGARVSRMYPRRPIPTTLLTIISSSRHRRPVVPVDGCEQRRIDIWTDLTQLCFKMLNKYGSLKNLKPRDYQLIDEITSSHTSAIICHPTRVNMLLP